MIETRSFDTKHQPVYTIGSIIFEAHIADFACIVLCDLWCRYCTISAPGDQRLIDSYAQDIDRDISRFAYREAQVFILDRRERNTLFKSVYRPFTTCVQHDIIADVKPFVPVIAT